MQLIHMSLFVPDDIVDGWIFPMLRLDKDVVKKRKGGFALNGIEPQVPAFAVIVAPCHLNDAQDAPSKAQKKQSNDKPIPCQYKVR
jgi:hypothetical protein